MTCNGGGCAAHYDGEGVQLVIGQGQRRRRPPHGLPGQPQQQHRRAAGDPAGQRMAGRPDHLELHAPGLPGGGGARTTRANIEAAFAKARNGVVAYKAGDRMMIAPISLMGFSAASSMVK